MNHWNNEKILNLILNDNLNKCEEQTSSPILRRRVKNPKIDDKICSAEILYAYHDFIYQFLVKKNLPDYPISNLFSSILNNSNISDFVETNSEDGFSKADLAAHALKEIKLLSTSILESHSDINSFTHPVPRFCVYAIKNTRRSMEDRHVIMPYFAEMYNQKSEMHFFAIFDGHGGDEAAEFASSRLPYILGNNLKLALSTDAQSITECMKMSITMTDTLFTQHANASSNGSGCTAICVLLEGCEKAHIAWLGDSQAIIFDESGVYNLTPPHKPEFPEEKARIEREGGSVVFMGTWRVNGSLSVARAIGDVKHKPYICSDADTNTFLLNNTSDFIVIACDGLYDVMSPSEIFTAVNNYRNGSIVIDENTCSSLDLEEFVLENLMKPKSENVSNYLVKLAKSKGSSDNISVIVVFLKRDSTEIISQTAAESTIELNKNNSTSKFFVADGSIQSKEEVDNKFNEAMMNDCENSTKLNYNLGLKYIEGGKFEQLLDRREMMDIVLNCDEINQLDRITMESSINMHLDRLQRLDCGLGNSSKDEFIFTGVSSSSGSACNALTSSNDSKRNVLESSTDTNINQNSNSSNCCCNKLSNSRSLDAIAVKEICNAGYEETSVCSKVKFQIDRKENIVPTISRHHESNYDTIGTNRRSSYIGSSRLSTGRSLMSHSMLETSSNVSLEPGIVMNGGSKSGRNCWTIAVEDEQDWTESFDQPHAHTLNIHRWYL